MWHVFASEPALSPYSLITQREQGLHLQSCYEPDGHSYRIRIDRKGAAAHPRHLELVQIIKKHVHVTSRVYIFIAL